MGTVFTVILTFIISFIITTLWHSRSTKTNNKNVEQIIHGLISEMDEMAVELGSEDFTDYLTKKRGKEYAYNANLNLINSLKYLNNK